MIPESLAAVLLIVTGALLVALDVKTFLGHGIAALAGLALAGWGVYLAMESADGALVFGLVTGSLILALVLAIALLRSGFAQGLVLTKATTGQPSALAEAAASIVGQTGVALTDLRPSGTAQIGGKRVDVVADDGAYVHRGAALRVVRVAQNSIIVSPVREVSP